MASPAAIIGRDDELAEVERFVDAVPHRPASLLIEGEAGIGKTTLWSAGVARARERLFWMLTCSPVEAETTMSFAALGDLLEPVLDETLARLPPPQVNAVQAALLRTEVEGAAPQSRAVALGVLGILRALATVAPVVVAVDDLQWLDAASARVLDFALRRLGDEPVGLLAARRDDGGRRATLALEWDRAIRVGPLDMGAVDRVLRVEGAGALAPPTLHKLHAASGGNPFYALEIARALGDSPAVAPGEPLPIPPNLADLVRARLKRLPAATTTALLAATALARPTRALLAAATDGADLAPAEEAGVVSFDGDLLRFRHPLLAGALYGSAPETRKRALHRRLAGIVADAEERARHLALAAEGPEETVAAALEAAATAARARGAAETAAELAEQAYRLTPADRDLDGQRRRVSAAENLLHCGDLDRARVVVEEALSALPPGPLRARALVTLALTQFYGLGTWDDALATSEQALREVGDDRRLRATLEGHVGWFYVAVRHAREAEPHVRAALELAEEVGDRVLLAEALAELAYVEFLRGRGFRRDLFERALALDTLYDHVRWARHPSWPLHTVCLWMGDVAGARSCLELLSRMARERGEESARPWLLLHLAAVEHAVGDWTAAAAQVEAAAVAADQTCQQAPRRAASWMRAWIDAHYGDVAGARAAAAELAVSGHEGARLRAQHLLGFIELSSGDAHRAVPHLREAMGAARRHGVEDPSVNDVWADAIEALIGAGELDEAEEVLTWLEERGRTLDRPWALATAGRCRALHHAARGEHAEALAASEGALREHERLAMPFERGRTLLAYGVSLRRAQRKRAARDALSEALALFDDLGARLWAERTRAEVARIGGRRPAGGELTPTEQRVAELVAEGRSNKEVAAALYVGVRSVEAHLTHIYAKLGLRSRIELARKIADRV